MARVCDNCDGRTEVQSVDLMVVGEGTNPAPLILDSDGQAVRNPPGTTHPYTDYCVDCTSLILKRGWQALQDRANMGKVVANITTARESPSEAPQSPEPATKRAKVPKPSGKAPKVTEEDRPEALPDEPGSII